MSRLKGSEKEKKYYHPTRTLSNNSKTSTKRCIAFCGIYIHPIRRTEPRKVTNKLTSPIRVLAYSILMPPLIPSEDGNDVLEKIRFYTITQIGEDCLYFENYQQAHKRKV